MVQQQIRYSDSSISASLLIIFLSFFSISCGTSSNNDRIKKFFSLSQEDNKSGSSLVYAENGGVVKLNDEATLMIPPYSLEKDTTISIERVANVPQGDADGLSPFGQAYRFSPKGTYFDTAVPAVLELSYDSHALESRRFSPQTIQVCYFDEELQSYVPVNCQVDTARKKIIAYIEHFTVYLPMAKALLPTNNAPYVALQASLPNPVRANAPIYARATVTDFDGSIAGVSLFYRKLRPTPGAWQQVRMAQDVQPRITLHTYGYLIPAGFLTSADLGTGNDIEYRVEATDNLGVTAVSATRRVNVTRIYQPGSVNITPITLDIASGFERYLTVRGVDNNGTNFNLVPETITLSSGSGSGSVKNSYANGVLYHALAQTPAGSPDNLTAGFGAESAAASINVHAGELASLEILDTNGLPIAGDIVLSEGSAYEFDVIGRDSFGNSILVIPAWSADPQIGVIDSDARLDTAGVRGAGLVTASLVFASDTQNVIVQSRAKELTSFSINSINGVIAFPFITVTLPWGTDVTALVPNFTTTGQSVTVNGAPQQSGVTANNFTNPVVYRVTAEDGSSQDYTVTVRMLKPFKEITAYSINGYNGIINGNNISVKLPIGTDVTSLVAIFTSTGDSVTVGGILQQSGVTANDFNSPVIYTVNAEDGTSQDFIVTVELDNFTCSTDDQPPVISYPSDGAAIGGEGFLYPPPLTFEVLINVTDANNVTVTNAEYQSGNSWKITISTSVPPFNQPGLYYYVITATDECGNTRTLTMILQVMIWGGTPEPGFYNYKWVIFYGFRD